MFKEVVSKQFVGLEYNPFVDGYCDVYEDVLERKFVAPNIKKKTFFSNEKVIVSGNVIEYKGYENPVFYGFESKGSGKKKSSGVKRKDKIIESKMALRRLINSNVTGNDLFVTLTYKENLQDVGQAKNDFKKFVMRLNYSRKKKGLCSLKYVYVIEFQERGAVHFHCIFFDVGYIKNSELSEIWQRGFVKINRINDVDNVGAYVVKYMDKALEDNRLQNRDLYGRSKGNLKEPLEIKEPQEVATLMAQLENVSPVYTKVYDTEYYGKMSYVQFNLKR